MPVEITSTLMQNHVAGVAPVPMKQLAVVCVVTEIEPGLFAMPKPTSKAEPLQPAGGSTAGVGWRFSDSVGGRPTGGGTVMLMGLCSRNVEDGNFSF